MQRITKNSSQTKYGIFKKIRQFIVLFDISDTKMVKDSDFLCVPLERSEVVCLAVGELIILLARNLEEIAG